MLTIIIALTVSPSASRVEPPRLAVLPLAAKRVPTETVEILDELLVNELARSGAYRVISASDINTMLGLERMKEAMGCDDVACAADIGGALGAELIVSGVASMLGGELIVSLKLVDTKKLEVVRRGQVTVIAAEEHYRGAVVRAVGELLDSAAARLPPAVLSAAGAPVAQPERPSHIGPKDWARYVEYRATAPEPVDLDPWIDARNEESTALFAGELAAVGLLALGLTLGLAGDEVNSSGMMGAGAVFMWTSIIGGAATLVIDALDIGAVDSGAAAAATR